MQNELGQSPKLVVCPSDDRTAANTFTNVPGSQFLPGNVSVFVGVGANDIYPQSIAGGDRNLQNGWTSAGAQDSGYGFSGETPALLPERMLSLTRLTYKVAANTGNTAVRRLGGMVWKIAFRRQHGRSGQYLVGDGSGQQMSSAGFQQNWLRNAGDMGNFSTPRLVRSPTYVRYCFP